jgi:hypothetical protein
MLHYRARTLHPGDSRDRTTLSQVRNESAGITFDSLCSDACLQDPECFNAAWGDFVLPALTESFPDKVRCTT